MKLIVHILRFVLELVGDFGLIGLLSLVVFMVAVIAKWAFQRFLKCHSRAMSAVFMAICITAAIWADKRNAPGNPSSPSVMITQDDIARGFVLADVSTNSQFSILNSQFPVDCQITTNLKWRLRGAYEDWFALPADGWRFPFRDGWMDKPAICAWGEVRPSIGETNALPPLIPFQVSLAPESVELSAGSSCFWHGVSPSNSLVLTWENALVERSPTNLASFQAEFFADGRFEYRRQEGGAQSVVVESYTPIFSFDYDGDGLENAVDPEPYAAGPDAHGTNAEWYNTVCSNVLEAVEGDEPNEPTLTWKDGINTNAYYFVDVVASRGPAALYFAGDARNTLGDLAIVALTAATNHVPLLMGVDYAVTATADFEIIPPGGGFAEISTNDEGIVHVKWPVNFYAMQTGTSSYYVEVSPVDPGGEFVWDGAPPMRGGTCSSSCLSSAFGPYVSFGCDGNCNCGGCYATGTYRYEGMVFSMPLIPCGCSSDDPQGYGIEPTQGPVSNSPPRVTTSNRAVIFEDRYENSPGQWGDKRSTSVTITITAAGGTDGGVLNIYTENMGKLNRLWGHTLPTGSVSIPAGYTMEWIAGYEAVTASESVDDIEITASFIPNGMLSIPLVDSIHMTSVKVTLEPMKIAPLNSCTNRHVFGVREKVVCLHEPNDTPIQWNVGENQPVFGAEIQGVNILLCPLSNRYHFQLKAHVYDADFEVFTSIVNPSSIICTNVTWDSFVVAPKNTAGNVAMLLSLCVAPLTVSFENIDVCEVPCYQGTHTEYFNFLESVDRVTHTVAAGAGVWHHVGVGNFFTMDRVQCGSRPQPWLAASIMIWQNPYGWHERSNADMWPIGMTPMPGNVFATDVQQVFTLEIDGFSSVSKLGHIVSRTTNDCVRLDGVIVKGME